jgi:hypothetical protein
LERCLAHLQQPEQHPLPPLAAKLGRQVPRSGKRRRWLRRCLAVAGLVILCAAALLLLRGPNEDETPVNPAPIGGESVARAPPDLKGLDTDVAAESRRVRAHLGQVEEAFAATPVDGPGQEPDFRRLAEWTAALGRQFHGEAPPEPDQVEVQLDDIRRRLELVRQQVGAGPE